MTSGDGGGIYRFGRYELDERTVELRCDGARVDVQPRVLDLLFYLAPRSDRVVSKRELLDALWGDVAVGEGVLTRAVSAARSATGDTGSAQRVIRTSPRIGYRFVAPLEVRPSRSEPAAVRPEPVPERAALDPFVGREEPLGRLLAAWRAAATGEGRAVLVHGEAGIGKTRLLHELAHGARSDGGRVLAGWCYDGEGAPSFWPWVQVLRDLVRSEGSDPERLRALLGSGAADLAEVAREVRAALPDLPRVRHAEGEEDRARFRLFDSLADFVRRLALDRPLLLMIEDLHWADRSTLRALAFVARETRDARVLIAGTFRDSDVVGRSPFAEVLASLAAGPPDERLALGGLSQDQVRRLLALLAGGVPSRATVAALWRRTEGNPLFVREVTRLLLDRGSLFGSAAPASWKEEIPVGVRAVIDARLARLSTGCREALATAAVIGRDFAARLLAEVAGLTAEQGAERLAEGVSAGILRASRERPGYFAFSHALIQEALRDTWSASRRAALHTRVVVALERQHADDPDAVVEELAEHALAAARSGVGPQRAIRYALRAGNRADEKQAYHEAADHFDHALEILERRAGSEKERSALLLEMAASSWEAGEEDRALAGAERAAAIAERSGNVDDVVRASLITLFRGPETEERYQRSLRLFERAERALGGRPTPLHSRMLARYARALLYTEESGPRRVELCRRALEMARSLGDEASVRVALLATLGTTWAQLGLEEREALANELFARAAGLGTDARVDVSVLFLSCSLERGDVAAVDREIAEIEARIEREPLNEYLRWYSPLYRGMRALLSGRLAEAERLILEAHRHGRKTRFYDAPRALEAQLFQLRIDQGRVGELEPAIRAARAQYPTDFTYPTVHAYALAETGRLDEAAQTFAEVMAGYDPAGDQNRAITLTVLASVCATLRDARAAERLYALCLPLAERVVTNLSAWICQGSTHWPLGKLARAAGHADAAARHLDLAIERNRALGARTYLARAELDRAELWLEQGERSAARRLLGRCFDAADEIGLVSVAQRARQLLHETLPGGSSDQETIRLR